MLAKRVIPCLDVNRGRVVKGTNFLNLRDAGDPVEVAARYEAEGADELVFLDITASHQGRDIPCLDVNRGRVVKGTNFLNLRDAGDPVEVAARYEAEGADELVFLDITASHEGRDIMLDVVRRTAEQVFMPLTVGGGICTIDDIRALLNAGSDKVSINSAACKNPQFVAEAAKRFGSQCIVVNIDPRRVKTGARGSGRVAQEEVVFEV